MLSFLSHRLFSTSIFNHQLSTFFFKVRMIVSICFSFQNQHDIVLEIQIFDHLVLRNKEPFKLTQEKRGCCERHMCCGTGELSGPQGSFGSLFLPHSLLFSLHVLCSLLLLTAFSIVSFLFLQNFTLPKVLLAEALAQFYGIIFSLGYIVWWHYFPEFPSSYFLNLYV